MMIDAQLNEFEKSDVFTPEEIAKRMVSFLTGNGTVLDPAVGTGNLINYLPETYTKIEVYDIKQPYLDACPKITNLCRKSVKRNGNNTNTGPARAADISISGPGCPTSRASIRSSSGPQSTRSTTP